MSTQGAEGIEVQEHTFADAPFELIQLVGRAYGLFAYPEAEQPQ